MGHLQQKYCSIQRSRGSCEIDLLPSGNLRPKCSVFSNLFVLGCLGVRIHHSFRISPTATLAGYITELDTQNSDLKYPPVSWNSGFVVILGSIPYYFLRQFVCRTSRGKNRNWIPRWAISGPSVAAQAFSPLDPSASWEIMSFCFSSEPGSGSYQHWHVDWALPSINRGA